MTGQLPLTSSSVPKQTVSAVVACPWCNDAKDLFSLINCIISSVVVGPVLSYAARLGLFGALDTRNQ